MNKQLLIGLLTCMWCLALSVPARADMDCETGAADDDAQLEQGTKAVAAGRDAEGFAILSKIQSACFDSGNVREKQARFVTETQAVGNRLAQSAVAAGKFDQALSIYFDIRNATYAYTEADVDRVILANARANKSDRNILGRALSHFSAEEIERWSSGGHRAQAKPHVAERARQMITYGAEARAIAQGQGDAALAAEAKAFAGRRGVGTVFGAYTQANIEDAKAWYAMIGYAVGIARANERAVARGDHLMPEDAASILGVALEYFTEAGATGKQQQVQEKAKRLGDAAAAKDQHERAAEYYEVAGLSERADAVMAAGEKKAEAAESKRQEEFKSGMDDLEEELGF